MRTSISLTIAVAFLLVPATVIAQAEAPEVTVVPDSQFCNLVSDDLAACEEALATLASARMLPDSFAGLMTATASAEAGPTAAGEPVTIKGKGNKNSEPFTLKVGDYEVTLKKSRGCDEFTYGYMQSVAGDGSTGGEISQNGFIYGVEEGRYYWEVTADDKCQWTYSLTPIQ